MTMLPIYEAICVLLILAVSVLCTPHSLGSYTVTIRRCKFRNWADSSYLMAVNLNCRHQSSQWRYYNTLIKRIDGVMIQQVSHSFMVCCDVPTGCI